MKRKVLILTDHYLPSIKGGGPIQSIKNLVDTFHDEIDFYILTSDRDLGDKKACESVVVNKWTDVGNAKVYYVNTSSINYRKIKNIIEDINCDILYLNSFFSFKTSIIPILLNKFKMISKKKILLAPRGQFSKGALGIKSWKKKIFIKLTKLLNLYENVGWHATTAIEKEDIESVFGKNIKVFTANNLTPNHSNIQYDKTLNKDAEELKLIYIARIHPMKNLLQTLKTLEKVEGKVEFNIYGPIEDKLYWGKCQHVINNLNKKIKVNYLGQIANEKVDDIYKEHHIAILMTLGENFGHSIAEALIGGCPVIISDRTPWRNLEKWNAGYDISLDREDKFVEAINHYIDMNNHDYKLNSRCAFEYAKTDSNTTENINSYSKMFNIGNDILWR